jgi:hypothetical protein
MLPPRHLVAVVCLVGPLSMLPIGCTRQPDRESDYRALAAHVAGGWRLARDDDLYHGHPPCFDTLIVEMDSPSTSTALVTFCGGDSPDLSRRVTVEVLHDAAMEEAHPELFASECRLSWESSSSGATRVMHVFWSDAAYVVSADEPCFYAEDVLHVDFIGWELPGEPAGAMVIYAREQGAATPAYSPK